MLTVCLNLDLTALDQAMNEFSTELIVQIEAALRNSDRQRSLLQQQERLREIMNDIPARQWLFEQACQTENCALAEKARLFIVRILQSPAQIWRGGEGNLSPEVYEEALARTQEWFAQNFSSYVPESASFVTWFNHHLKWRIADVKREIEQAGKRRKYPYLGEDGEAIDPIDLIPAPSPDRWEETIQNWLELIHTDPVLRSCRMQNALHVNGQDLLTQILQALHHSGEFSWESIAQSYDVEPSSLKRFCRTRCFPRFQQLWSE